MHPWRLAWKGGDEARLATEPHPQLSGLDDSSVCCGLGLAPVGEAIAAAAGKDGASPEVQPGDASPTVVAKIPVRLAISRGVPGVGIHPEA